MGNQISQLFIATSKADQILPDPCNQGTYIEGNLESNELSLLSLTLQFVSGNLRKVLIIMILQLFIIIKMVYLIDYCYFK